MNQRIHLALAHDRDLVLLFVLGIVFAVLDVVGVAKASVTVPLLLGLLSLLAFSQIVSRQQVAEMATQLSTGPLDRLLMTHPPELESRRNAADDVLLIGMMLERTTRSYAKYLREALRRDAKVRVLITAPEHFERVGREELAEKVRANLGEFESARPGPGDRGELTIKVLHHFPSGNFNVLDATRPEGVIAFQRHEYRPLTEAAPVLVVSPTDGVWYQHFQQEAERMWGDGVEWNPAQGG